MHRTDNGPPFGSALFSEYSKPRGIIHEKSFPYHPQANVVETFMKPLGKCMKAAFHTKQEKGKALNNFLSTYRATPHSAIGIAPGDILFRHQTSIEKGGIQCQTPEGVKQRRHLDDVKPYHADEKIIEAPAGPSTCHRSPDCPIQIEDQTEQNISQPRRSVREKKPNTKFNNFILY